MSTDYPDWGVFPTTLAPGTNIPAGSTVTLFDAATSSQGYIAAVDALCQNAPATPAFKLAFLWKDSQGGSQLPIQHWFPLMTNISPADTNCLLTGRGPVDAPWLTVLAHNYDTASITLDFELIQTALGVPDHDWRNVTNNIRNTYTYGGLTFSTPVSDGAEGDLGSSPAISVAAGSQQVRVNSLFSGQRQIYVQQVTPFAGTVTLYKLNPDYATPVTPIFSQAMPASGQLLIPQFSAPRCPVIISLANTSAGAGTYSYETVAV